MYNPFNLEGKTILITGASSGIGRATAIECSKMGAKIIACGRNKERLENTLELLQGKDHKLFLGDLRDLNGIRSLVKNVTSIEGLVLAAGKGLTVPFLFSKPEMFNDVFANNFFSHAEILRLFAKKKILRPSASVVIIVSVGGTNIFVPGNVVYGTAKSALNSLVRFAAMELSNKRIRVNGISPGMTETPLIHEGVITEEQLEQDKERYPLKRYGQPEDIAKGAVYLLSDASSWVTGHTLVIDGGISI
ncbi:SDR family oxidoreductase [Fibrobacter sp.]|uniref:SDR family NAD(P)-dependent oxidoreductase n=1 Tax=Fibrobacter sp. TaxID=35828 RepID=UPI0025BBF501|nr:SDR family oxidoreductase [Fibrobacter sp.]MBR4008847.1 SDR family oxidoreductase [Fibrobacter sp.]